MKHTITKILSGFLILLFIFQTTGCFTARPEYAKIYRKAKREKHVFGLKIPPGFLKMFVSKEDPELKKIMKHLNDFRIVIFDDDELTKEFISSYDKEINEFINEKSYNPLMMIQDGGDKINISLKEKKKDRKEVILLISDNTSLVLVGMRGKFSDKDIQKLAKNMDLKNMH